MHADRAQRTFYGEQWLFGAGGDDAARYQDLEFSDTAYTTEAIGVHNDGTYFTHPPGIQVDQKFILLLKNNSL